MNCMKEFYVSAVNSVEKKVQVLFDTEFVPFESLVQGRRITSVARRQQLVIGVVDRFSATVVQLVTN